MEPLPSPLLEGISFHPDAQKVFNDPQVALEERAGVPVHIINHGGMLCLVDAGMDINRKEVVEILQALIRTGCVNYGNGKCDERPNIKVVSDYLDTKGIPYEIHHMPGYPNRPNLIAKYGSGKPRVMLGPGHVDVVPVKSAANEGKEDGDKSYPNWHVPPFSGAIKDGMIYGRGACDMLSTVAVQVVVFAHVAKSGVPIKGTLLFAAVSDEEDGGTYGVGYLLRDPVLKEVFQADYTVTEIGGTTMVDKWKKPTKEYIQTSSEKGTVILEVECKGKPGHGSVPLNGDNALVRAAQVINRISTYWAPTVITDEWRSLISAIDAPFIVRWLLTQSWAVKPLLKILVAIGNPLGPLGHAGTRMTLSANHVTGSQKANVVPGSVTVEVDARVLPGQDKEYVLDQLRCAVGKEIYDDKEHYDFRIRFFYPATKSSIDTPFWRAMDRAGKVVVPGARFHKTCLPGGTDNRFYRALVGAQSYGFNVFHPSTTIGTFMACIHGDNERIGIQDMWASLHFFALTAVYMMVTPE